MEVRILHLLEGAREASGTAVIIDVYRAFSTICYLFQAGVDKVYLLGSLEKAYQMKAEDPSRILIGERGGKKCEGFDFGNSPSTIEGQDLSGKTAVFTTSAGTQGIANAVNAREIFTGSIVNARATARQILKENPGTVSLVCMGLSGKSIAEEDELCAQYLRSLLLGHPMEDIAARAQALRATAGAKFFDPAKAEIYPAPDFACCSVPDRFDFSVRVRTEGGIHIAEKNPAL